MIAASASPGRDETRHLSPSKAAGLLHDSSCLKQLRDQSPKTHGNFVQPVVSYSGHGAVITTAGPVLSPESPMSQQQQQAPMSYLAAAVAPRQVLTTAVGASPGTASPADQQQQDRAVSPAAASAAAAVAAAGGKRAAALIRGQLEDNNSFTAAQRAPKHQVGRAKEISNNVLSVGHGMV
jgi:hypothetical protein